MTRTRTRTPSESSPTTSWRGCSAATASRLWDEVQVTTADEAVAAADLLGYPVALKATAAHLRHRRELGGVRLDIDDEEALRAAFTAQRERLGDVGPFAVQAMAPTGVACRLATVEDPLFGPVVSFGLGGMATDLLGDRSYGVPPLTDTDLAGLVRSVRAFPLLLGPPGGARLPTWPLSRTCSPGWPGWPTTSPRWPRSSSTRWSSRPAGAAVLAATGRLAPLAGPVRPRCTGAAGLGPQVQG